MRCKANSCSRPAREDGYCIGHSPAQQRETRKQNPERFKRYSLKRDYGIAYEQYLELLEQQKGCCAICGTSPEATDKKLAVDHCHTTGVVRGLLCPACNLGIGSFRDSADLLLKAAEYLKKDPPKVKVLFVDAFMDELANL